MKDNRPTNCRERLREEGKPYPRSSCQGCGGSIRNGITSNCPGKEADPDAAKTALMDMAKRIGVKVETDASHEYIIRRIEDQHRLACGDSYRDGYRKRLADLTQNGMQISADFFVDGLRTGRFHAFFPGTTSNEQRAAHFEDMARWERAALNATRLDFGDATRKD